MIVLFKKYYIHSLLQIPSSKEFIAPFTGDSFIRNMVAETSLNFSSELVLWDIELSTLNFIVGLLTEYTV